MPDDLAGAWTELHTASRLALDWVAVNAQTVEAWEIRIAGAEVVDVFQQVAMHRAGAGDPAASIDATSFAAGPAPDTPSGRRRRFPLAASAPPVSLLPDGLKDALAQAALQLEALGPGATTQAQAIPLDANRLRYGIDGDARAGVEDSERRRKSTRRALAQQCRDVQAGLLALNQRLALQKAHAGSLPGKDGAPPSPPAGPAGVDPSQRYRDQADKLRGRMDTFGKALGAIGTTLVSAAGISRIDGLYPIPPGDIGLIWGVFASLVVGLAAVMWIALRLNKVANPISLRSDIDDLVAQNEITFRESRLVREVYRRTYELNNAATLLAYELRGLRLDRIGGWIGDATSARVCSDRGAEVRADIDVTLARASATLVRRRATRALTAGWAPPLYAAFVAAIVGFAVCSGGLTSDQTGRIAIAKSCGDARASLTAAGGATTTNVTTVTTGGVPTTRTIVTPAPATDLAALPAICRPRRR